MIRGGAGKLKGRRNHRRDIYRRLELERWLYRGLIYGAWPTRQITDETFRSIYGVGH